LRVLIDAFPEGIRHLDKKGRTPLHFALSNAGRPTAPSIVRLLLSLDRFLVDSGQENQSPLKFLGKYASTLSRNENKEQRESCTACLKHLLAARPTPTPDFFTTLQSLPPFLKEVAVVAKGVQVVLNLKIAQRFCTMILMLDFYMQMMVVGCFSMAAVESIESRFKDETTEPTPVRNNLVYPLYVGLTYFFFREVVNFLSLLFLGALRSWAHEPSTWLNVFYIVLIYLITMHMSGTADKDLFRTVAAACVLLIWMKFLSYLRNIMIDFAVFTGGVFHIINRLAAFLLCLVIILVAFSRIFFTLFQMTEYCTVDNPKNQWTPESRIRDMQCGELELNPWCDNWDSILAMITFLLGEVDASKFPSKVSLALFVILMFLVVILLANVLIAVIADSYKIMQDKRSAIVFWTNRLNFISQMDAIDHGPWKSLLYQTLGMKPPVRKFNLSRRSKSFGSDTWDTLMHFLADESETTAMEYFSGAALRFATIVFIVPSWIVLGMCTAGWFWPPQIRAFIFTSAELKYNSESEKEEELRNTQVEKVKTELATMGEELRQELALDRMQVMQTKTVVAQRKTEIQAEMKNIQRLVTMLFEDQGY